MTSKYIVYCTTNKVNGKIYIGVHKTVDPEGFDGYIGCGVYVNNPGTYNFPKTKFQQAVKKYGPSSFRRHVIKVFDDEDSAYLLESELVDYEFLKRSDVYNMVIGGYGGTKSEAKITYQYDLNGNLINVFASMIDAGKYINSSSWNIHYAIKMKYALRQSLWSHNKYEKLNISSYRLEEPTMKDRMTPCYQYSETGEFECCYESIRSCVRINNLDYSNLSTAITFGTKCCGKYYSTEFFPTISIARNEKRKITVVYQYDLEGNFVKEWVSALQARKQLGFTSDIYKAIKNNRTAGNFYWSLEKVDKLSIKKPISGRARKIGKYDKDGNLIKTYDTIRECKRENGGAMVHVLSGRNQYHKGFHYEYLT